MDRKNIFLYLLVSALSQTNVTDSTCVCCLSMQTQMSLELIEIELASIIMSYIIKCNKTFSHATSDFSRLCKDDNALQTALTFYQGLILNVVNVFTIDINVKKLKATMLYLRALYELLNVFKKEPEKIKKEFAMRINALENGSKQSQSTTNLTMLQDCILIFCCSLNLKTQMIEVINENKKLYFFGNEKNVFYAEDIGQVVRKLAKKISEYSRFNIKIDEIQLLNIIVAFDEFLLNTPKTIRKKDTTTRHAKLKQYLAKKYPCLIIYKSFTKINYVFCGINEHKIDYFLSYLDIYKDSELDRKNFLDCLSIIKNHFEDVFLDAERRIENLNEKKLCILLINDRTNIF